MRPWREYDAQYNEPRVALHCVQCGEIDRPYLVDADQDGEVEHQCLRCVRDAQDRRRAVRAAWLATDIRDIQGVGTWHSS